jgi:death-on-curing protein
VTRYPTIEDIVAIHATLIATFGGAGGIRHQHALEAALARPQARYYDDVIQQAAALWQSLSENHLYCRRQ